jgi:hypothetical protein
MKRLIVSGMAITILFAAGCAHPPKPEFNQAYMPDTVPGSPQKRTDLPKQVIDKVSVNRWSLFGKSTTYLPTSLYWVEEDNLLFNVTSEDNKSLLYSFLIIPSTGEIKSLEGAEKNALLSAIAQSTSFVSTKSTGGKIADVIISIVVGLTGKTARFKDPYMGKVENNGTVLDFDITLEEKGGWSFSTTDYELAYVAKNNRTETILKGDCRFAINLEFGVENEMKKWLKSWRVSPDGRYYVIGNTVTFVDAAEGTFTTLIENYEHVFAGFDISPRWDKIALLVVKDDEKTKQKNYWIEFYPFSYRSK